MLRQACPLRRRRPGGVINTKLTRHTPSVRQGKPHPMVWHRGNLLCTFWTPSRLGSFAGIRRAKVLETTSRTEHSIENIPRGTFRKSRSAKSGREGMWREERSLKKKNTQWKTNIHAGGGSLPGVHVDVASRNFCFRVARGHLKRFCKRTSLVSRARLDERQLQTMTSASANPVRHTLRLLLYSSGRVFCFDWTTNARFVKKERNKSVFLLEKRARTFRC